MAFLQDLREGIWTTDREELKRTLRSKGIEVSRVVTATCVLSLLIFVLVGSSLFAGTSSRMDNMFRRSIRVTPHIYTYDGKLVIPPQSILETLSRPELEDLFHRYVENIQYSCHNQVHYGLESDGGYYLCEDVKIRPPCMMYSFGTRNDYSFDDKVANVIGCDVHSFDPGDGQRDHRRSKRVWFHAIGLGGHTRAMVTKGQGEVFMRWLIYSLDDTRDLLDHRNRTLDILKIDTEGMIWETLVDIARPGVIDDVRFLIVELHTNFPPNLPFEEYRSKADYIEHLVSLRRLYDLGFQIYYFQRWYPCKIMDDLGDARTGCHDIHFIQTKFL